jgi:hypothetical protein
MARLYSTRLMASEGAADALFEEVPAGFIWVVRDIVLTFDGADSADGYQVGVQGKAPILLGQVAGGNVEQFHWTGRQVMEAGETLAFTASTLNWYILVSGYQLSTP